MNLKIGDTVKYNKFPFENDVFIIVADKNKPWAKASPYKSSNFTISVQDKKDFILLRKKDEIYGTFGIDEDGLHVTSDEIQLNL